jgi:competence protein ComEC
MTPPPAPMAFPTVIDEVNDSETWSDFRFPKDKPLLEIWIANIRDADATLILYEGQAWMIDCADQKMALRTAAMLRKLGITHIQKMFNSHPHHDHILGLSNILEAAGVDELLLCFPEDSTEHMEKVLPLCEERQITVSHYSHGDEFTMGDGNVKLIFWQNEGSDLSMNNRSACTKIVYGDRSMLLLADLEYRGEQELEDLVGAEALKCDLFKYPHHGKQALKESFFQGMDASLAVVTNHQKIEKASSYLGYKHFPTIYTNVKGVYTHLATDGRRWLCEYVPIR